MVHLKAPSNNDISIVTVFDILSANSINRKKDETVSTGWGKKLRAALRPSWLGADTKLAGNPTLDPEEECNYDTGIDLTEADFIVDDLDADDSAG